ncbi:axoneme-associated protein mst101(2)-like [Drosophila novamexicana]|uniref:axoneme-associated protein mst101(2)-like n=1 Tax=Drosophila novamexicana TaxID=47314 RepID=UPI0011E5EACC|nr:axoneme-associated protein mst101(2)-like [Drosophila novamexicana]
MWRICNCVQLQPILNGCKRCQLPTEVNRNIRGSPRSQPPQCIDSNTNPSEKEPRRVGVVGRAVQKNQNLETKFKSCSAYSRQQNSNSCLCDGNSSRKPAAKKTTDIYAKQTLPIENKSEAYFKWNVHSAEKTESSTKRHLFADRKAEACPKRHMSRKRAPIKSSWYGGSKKFLDRLKQLLYEPSTLIKKTQSDRFYDCDEPSSAKSELFPISDRVSKKTVEIKPEQLTRECNITTCNTKKIKWPKAVKRKPSNISFCSQQEQLKNDVESIIMPNPREDVILLGQRPSNIRSTEFTAKQKPQKSGSARCIKCDAKSKPQKADSRTEKFFCKKSEIKMQEKKSITPNVITVYSGSKSGASTPQSNFQLRSQTSPSISRQNVDKGATVRSALGKKSGPAKSIKENSNMYSSNYSEGSADPVENFCGKTNILFQKLKAIPFSNGAVPKTSKKSSSDYRSSPPKSSKDKYLAQTFCKDLSAFKKSEQESTLDLFEGDLNSLFSRVKHSSSDLWRNQPPSKKFEEALENLRQWENYIICSNPAGARFSERKELELDKIAKYVNDMQKRNNLRNQKRHLMTENTPKSIRLGKKSSQTSILNKALNAKMSTIGQKLPNLGFDLSSTHKSIFLDPVKSTKSAYSKTQLHDLRYQKARRIKDMQQNEKRFLDPKDANINALGKSWMAYQRTLDHKLDSSRLEEEQSNNSDEVFKFQLKVETLQKGCNAKNVSNNQSDINYINSEVRQIDDIIRQCQLLRSKYSMRLEDKHAQGLQQKLQRNNSEIKAAGSILPKKCVEANEKQKNQFILDRLKKFQDDDAKKPKLPGKYHAYQLDRPKKEAHLQKCKEYPNFDPNKTEMQNKCNAGQFNSLQKEAHPQKCKEFRNTDPNKTATKNKCRLKNEARLQKCEEAAKMAKSDECAKPCQTASKNSAKVDRKCKRSEIKNSECEKMYRETVLSKHGHVKDGKMNTKKVENAGKGQEAGIKMKCQESERHHRQIEQRKPNTHDIREKTETIDKIYQEAKKRVAILEQQLKKCFQEQELRNRKSQVKGITMAYL